MSNNSIVGAIWSKTHLVLALGLLGLAVILGISWRDGQRVQSRLQATIDSTNKTIARAAGQESTRDAQLENALAQIAELKARVKTPAQALAALPSALPKLPEPIEVQSASAASESQSAMASTEINALGSASSATGGTSATASSVPPPAVVKIPQADLKSLYDAAEDCKACQAKLSTAQADLADTKTQLVAASAQRDAALKVAKGDNLWTRTKRAAKWLALGALCGAVAARAAH